MYKNKETYLSTFYLQNIVYYKKNYYINQNEYYIGVHQDHITPNLYVVVCRYVSDGANNVVGKFGLFGLSG